MNATSSPKAEPCASDESCESERSAGIAERLPSIPGGRRIRLKRRGTTFYREVEGPPGAPTLLLLHGWIASGGLNWLRSFEPLGRHFRVIALDQRGHGRGIRNWRRFRLEDCADDAAALLEALEIDSAIAVGYSMGGPVAQLLWHRHAARVDGLVLCATSARFARGSQLGRSMMRAAANTARLRRLATSFSPRLRRPLIDLIEPRGARSGGGWAVADMGRHDLRMLVEAAEALERYSAEDWFREIDVPTAVVVTTQDRTVKPEDQMKLALHIREAKAFCVDLGHSACADPRFAEGLVTACRDVAARNDATPRLAALNRGRRWIEARVDALLA
jgi:pimeloyl-ACP methyl ester carboxylesterase